MSVSKRLGEFTIANASQSTVRTEVLSMPEIR